MTLHFESIGIPFIDHPITSDRMSDLARRGESQLRSDGGRMITWRDTSGAVMVFNTDRQGRILCAMPSFDSKSTIRIKLSGFGSDPECRFCDPLIGTQPIEAQYSVTGNEEPGPTFVFHLANCGTVRRDVSRGQFAELTVTGFTERPRIWKSGSDYLNEHPNDQNASNEMFGATFDPKSPSPSQYWTKSVVRQAKKLKNSVTNVSFYWAEIGAHNPLEIVVAEDDAPFGLEAGNIIEAGLWICAWLPEHGSPQRVTRRWQTLFRRRA